jgi:hypothetical protein
LDINVFDIIDARCNHEDSVLFFGFGASRFIFHPLRTLLIEETERSRLEHARIPRGLADEDEGIVDGVLVSGSDMQ